MYVCLSLLHTAQVCLELSIFVFKVDTSYRVTPRASGPKISVKYIPVEQGKLPV